MFQSKCVAGAYRCLDVELQRRGVLEAFAEVLRLGERPGTEIDGVALRQCGEVVRG
jgi:hypothetical protein